MRIAVEGCAHGELDQIYEIIESRRAHINTDLLICCGDFQSVRNHEDLKAMAVPQHYQRMTSFHKYYSGEKTAPILTLFIGGNHEASNYLQELPYGGWVAPNIYYLGRAGVVKYGDLKIAGISGIFKNHSYLHGHWECVPYSQNSLRTVYHVRSLEYYRLKQLKEKVHIMLSHDWPSGITDYGDVKGLLKRKPFFREDVRTNRLGNPPNMRLLRTMKPDYWFAAHLHCKFKAVVNHDDNTQTQFLALDKCLHRRPHLQIIDIPSKYDGDKCLKYDAEWLAILKNTNHLLTVTNVDNHLPGPGGCEKYNFTPSEDEKENIPRILGSVVIDRSSFVRTAPVYDVRAKKVAPKVPVLNPQTVNLCEKLRIDDPVQLVMARSGRTMKIPYVSHNPQVHNTSRQQNEAQSPVVPTPTRRPRQPLWIPAPLRTPTEGGGPLQLEDSLQTAATSMSGSLSRYNFTPSEDETENIPRILGSLVIDPSSFVRTAPVYDVRAINVAPNVPVLNPQTVDLCDKLRIDDPVQLVMAQSGRTMNLPYESHNPEVDNTSRQQNEAQSPVGPLQLEDSLQTAVTSMSGSFGSNLFYEDRTPMSANYEETVPLYYTVDASELSPCLPAPDTPIEGKKPLPLKDPLERASTSKSVTFVSTTFYECRTPMSAGSKKAMKRRNISSTITSDPDESVSTESSSLVNSESPKCSKLA